MVDDEVLALTGTSGYDVAVELQLFSGNPNRRA
jgi:hypothetical protein